MARDYRHLRSRDECGPILTYLAQNPKLRISEADIAKALCRRSSVIMNSMYHLLYLRLVNYELESGKRYFFLTDEGVVAAEQLNT